MNMRTILSTSTAVDGPCALADSQTTLDRVRVGDACRVVDIAGEDAVAIRLFEMGLTPGTQIRVIGQAPFGDPMELELRSYHLSIRRAEAARVTVQ